MTSNTQRLLKERRKIFFPERDDWSDNGSDYRHIENIERTENAENQNVENENVGNTENVETAENTEDEHVEHVENIEKAVNEGVNDRKHCQKNKKTGMRCIPCQKEHCACSPHGSKRKAEAEEQEEATDGTNAPTAKRTRTRK
ncbi:hypothetical protein MPER_05986 [Moniliophthora perniciosa FA553]|nr:hypothetical protein MPER_05986 [Moniliophthora perniciosa FA553]